MNEPTGMEIGRLVSIDQRFQLAGRSTGRIRLGPTFSPRKWKSNSYLNNKKKGHAPRRCHPSSRSSQAAIGRIVYACTEFLSIVLGFTEFYWVFLNLKSRYWVLPSLTWFSNWVLLGYIGFYLIYLWFYWILGFTGLRWVLPSFQRALLGISQFYRVLICFT